MIKNVNGPFTFWKGNKTDAQFSLSGDQLLDKFKAWLLTKKKDFLEYYSSDRIVRCFLTEDSGIASTFQEKEFPQMLDLLQPIYLDYTYPQPAKTD